MIGHAFLVFVDFHRFFSRIMTISIHMNVPEWGSAVYCFVPVHNIAEYNNQIKSNQNVLLIIKNIQVFFLERINDIWRGFWVSTDAGDLQKG